MARDLIKPEPEGVSQPPRDVLRAILRGLAERCPNCGRGALFWRYLKVSDVCPACGEELHHHRADDAPPYFTILIVGHIVIGGVLWTERAFAPPSWLHAAIWLPRFVLAGIHMLAVISVPLALLLTGATVADWLGQGIDPSPILSRVRDQADRHRHEWLARILRAVLLAVPRFDDGPFEVLTVTVEKSATDSSDQWCMAVAALFSGLGRALDEAHPLELSAAIGRLDDASARFASLGAEVLAVWAQAAAMALLVDSHAPRDGVRDRSLRITLEATRLTNSSFVCAPALAPRVDPQLDAPTVPTGTTTLRSWIAQAAQPTAGATTEHSLAPVVQVRCFGALTLRFDGLDLDLAGLKPRPRSLLRYLAVRAGRWVHRDELIESLWPQLSAVTATNSLHVALTAIRNVLGVRSVLLRRNGETYCFEACDDHDLRAFEKLLDQAGAAHRAGDTVSARSIGEQALALYGDDLLADEGAGEWAVTLREQYRRTFVHACEALAVGHLRAGDDRAAAIVARRGLACDRYSDDLWRTLQYALTSAGLLAESARAEGEYRAVLLELGLAGTPAARVAPRSSSVADAEIVSASDDGLLLGVRSR